MIKLQDFIEKLNRLEKRHNSIFILVVMLSVLILSGLTIGLSIYGKVFMLGIPIIFLMIYIIYNKHISKSYVPVCPFCGKALAPGWGRIIIASRHCCFCGKKIIED